MSLSSRKMGRPVGQAFLPDESGHGGGERSVAAGRICQAGKPDLHQVPYSLCCGFYRGARRSSPCKRSRCAGLEDGFGGCGFLGSALTGLLFQGRLEASYCLLLNCQRTNRRHRQRMLRLYPFGNTHPPRPGRVTLMCRVVSPAHELGTLEHKKPCMSIDKMAHFVENVYK